MGTPVVMAVDQLIKQNVRHLKTGVFTGKATWQDIIPHLVKETRELNIALAEIPYEKGVVQGDWKSDNVEEELADIYGVFVHAVLKAGYSMQQIEQRCLLKFAERFENVEIINHPRIGPVGIRVRDASTDVEDTKTSEGARSEGC
jgi:hypothetical protein